MLIAQAASAEGYFRAGGSSISGTGLTAGINVGIVAGVDMMDNVALELDIDTSLIKAKASSIDVNYQTSALYAAFRSGTGNYLKAKLGYHSTTSKATGFSANSWSAIAYGIGMGFGDGYEVEYTHLAPETGSDGLTKISITKMF